MLCLLALYFARITAMHTHFSYILVILFFEYFCILYCLLNLYIPTLLSSYTEIIYPCLPEQLFLPRHCLISASLFVLFLLLLLHTPPSLYTISFHPKTLTFLSLLTLLTYLTFLMSQDTAHSDTSCQLNPPPNSPMDCCHSSSPLLPPPCCHAS